MIYVCTLGASLETANRGVSALAASIGKLLAQHLFDARITMIAMERSAPATRTILSADRPVQVNVLRFQRAPVRGLANSGVVALLASLLCRLIPIPAVRAFVIGRIPLLRAISSSDFVVDVFGGDSFTDQYGVVRLFWLSLASWCVVLLDKPYVLLPQTYGPFRTRCAQMFARSLITRASLVFTRTQNDFSLKSLWKSDPPATHYCPDVAFVLDADRSRADLVPFNARTGQVTIGLNISGLLYSGGYTRNNMFDLRLCYPQFAKEIIANLLRIEGVQILLVPHTYSVNNLNDVENDLGACLRVADTWLGRDDRVHVISEELDQHQIKGVIGRCDFFIGSRLHACIAALSQGIVTAGVGYSKKFVEVFSTLGLEELVIDARTTGTVDAVDRVVSLAMSRARFSQQLNLAVAHNQQLIQQSFSLIGATFQVCEDCNSRSADHCTHA